MKEKFKSPVADNNASEVAPDNQMGAETVGQQPEEKENTNYNWEDFDCAAYVGNNYETPLDPDRAILGRLVDFYQDLPPGGSVLEIGAGPNLYPILAASKTAGEIHVTDYPKVTQTQTGHQFVSGYLSCGPREFYLIIAGV